MNEAIIEATLMETALVDKILMDAARDIKLRGNSRKMNDKSFS